MTGIREMLHRQMDCGCGRAHFVPIRAVETDIDPADLPGKCEELLGGKRALFLCDAHTRSPINETLTKQFMDHDWKLDVLEFEREALVNDEGVLGAAVFRAGPQVDGIIAVGGGTVTDLGRFVGSRLGKPFVLYMTCPSMDGYASDVAGMMVNGAKKIFKDCAFPDGIFSSAGVLCGAPYDLIKSGFGDMLGKRTALADWVLSRQATGEYFCGRTAQLMEEQSRICMDAAEGISRGDPAAILGLSDALVWAGICMALASDTRPASGSEHLISHYLVEGAIRQGRNPPTHGASVGFGTLVCAHLYEYLFEVMPAELEGVEAELRQYLPNPQDVARLLEVSRIGSDPGIFLSGSEELGTMLRDCSGPKKKYTILRFLTDHGLLKGAIGHVQWRMF